MVDGGDQLPQELLAWLQDCRLQVELLGGVAARDSAPRGGPHGPPQGAARA